MCICDNVEKTMKKYDHPNDERHMFIARLAERKETYARQRKPKEMCCPLPPPCTV
jgi:hypothetical protein